MPLIPDHVSVRSWQLAVRVIDWIAPVDQQKSPTAEHLVTGRWGEEAALFYLRKLGFVVVAQGWTSAKAPGDLDLVAWEGDTVCVVEVKTRSSRAVATAEAAVDRQKRRTLRRLASHYMRQMPEKSPSRFDVLSIYRTREGADYSTQYELFRNAFGWSERQD